MRDREWIDISSIDIWLMNIWENSRQRRARYIPSTFLTTSLIVNDPGDEEIDTLRGLFDDLPERGTPCPQETLLTVLNNGDGHFYVVVFAPNLGSVYRLGRNYLADKTVMSSNDWESWSGMQIWRKMCLLMGWTPESATELRTTDWKQNGYDCGPIACQVAQDIIARGMRTEETGEWKRTSIICSHTLRIKMAQFVQHVVMEETEKYALVRKKCGSELERIYGSGLEGMDAIHCSLSAGLWMESTVLHSIEQSLRQAIASCQECHAIAEEERHLAAVQEHPIPLPSQDIRQAKVRYISETLKGGRKMRNYVAGEEDETDEIEGQGEVDLIMANIEDGQSFDDLTHNDIDGESRPSEEKRDNPVDWKEARLGRFPRPRKVTPLPPRSSLVGLRLPFKRNFDDYEGGPTLEELAPLPERGLQFQQSMMYFCRQIMMTPQPFSLFKDYGYRLLPCFAQAFYLGDPIQVKDHLCPVGLSDPPPSGMNYVDQGGCGRGGKQLTVKDSVVVGAERLLNKAERDPYIFLTGKTRHSKYIVVDLLRDRVEPDRLELSVDVDSLIWITQDLRFKKNMFVYNSPVIRKQAPIWKSNHVHIQVLYPQTEEDQDTPGERSEWVTNSHTLSGIPHLLLGTLDGPTLVEILVFFPRMIHRNHRHFRVTCIPGGIQNYFWDSVVLPALKHALPTTRSAYMPGDREHSAFKSGSGKPSNCAVDPADVPKLARKMRRIVRLTSVG